MVFLFLVEVVDDKFLVIWNVADLYSAPLLQDLIVARNDRTVGIDVIGEGLCDGSRGGLVERIRLVLGLFSRQH